MNIGAQNLCTVKSLHITYNLDVVYTVPPYLQFASTDSTKHELCNIVILTTEKKKKQSQVIGPIQFKPLLYKGQVAKMLIYIQVVKY